MKRKARILLIEPPRTIYGSGETKRHGFPLGLGYLAASLEQADIEVNVLDCVLEGFDTEQELGNNLFRYGLSDREIIREIESAQPDIVGISNLFSDQIAVVRALCQLVKEIDPDLLTVVGGNHVTALPEHLLTSHCVDFIVQGEGEAILPELISVLIEGGDLSGVRGIGYKRDGQVVINARRAPIEDLDSLPFPARHLFPFERYFRITSTFGDSIWGVVSPGRKKKSDQLRPVMPTY
ncbi:cobalamin-dependent protein [bacterium]|nr:cobalamin-dependent protein [bacterium]